MQVGIVAQRDNPRAGALAGDVATRLTDAMSATVVTDEATAEALSPDGATGVPIAEMATCDLVVSIGGDGTFLYAARAAGTTPIMGVNLGEVGFLNAVAPGEAVEVVHEEVRRLEDGTVRTRDLPRLRADGDGFEVPPAINEIAILGPQRGHGNGVDLEIRVDGSLYTSGHADGVLVATPTGSTAYNLSEGGPLVHPDTPAFVVTEMAATGGMPPLVVEGSSTIEVRVDAPERAVVVSDGRIRSRVSPPTVVTLERAGEPVRIAGPPLDFFTGLGKLDS